MVSFKDWDLLANYQSYELVARDYFARHGRTPNTRHAREIAAPFIHARSYFRAAQLADQTVKPLLLYYGVVNLSRGVTLILTRGLREAALTPSHGLSVRAWGDELSTDNPDFGTLAIEVTGGGSFVELSRATGFLSLLRASSSAVNFTYTNPQIATGAQFTLADILSRLPALQDHYRRWRGDTRCLQPNIEAANDAPSARISFTKLNRPWVTRPVAEALFAGTPFSFENETAEQLVFTGPNQLEALPGLTDDVRPAFLNIGDLWLTALYDDGAKLSKISALFSLSYFLGMLVRYFPMQWTALLRGQFEDAALPTITAAVEVIENDFPSVVLDFLSN